MFEGLSPHSFPSVGFFLTKIPYIYYSSAMRKELQPTPSASDEARLKCIRTAAEEGFDLNENQTPDWLKKGVNKITSGEEVTAKDLREFDRGDGYI